MTPEEQNLDMLVAELDRENRLLRARNERLERETEARKPWVGLTEDEVEVLAIKAGFTTTDLMMVGYSVGTLADLIDAALREKNQ